MKCISLICLSWLFSFFWFDVVLGQNLFGWSISEIEEAEENAQTRTMSDVVMAEQFDYPVLENTTNYTNRISCLDKLDDQFEDSLKRTSKTIKRELHWLEIYKNGGRYILFCDYNYVKLYWELNTYWDDNNNIPPSWFMVRNSINAMLLSE